MNFKAYRIKIHNNLEIYGENFPIFIRYFALDWSQ